jgi:phosphoadenosine phosphosulfate reductase
LTEEENSSMSTSLRDRAEIACHILGSVLRQRKAAVLSSFGSESAVLLDLVAQVDRTVPVFFIDTGRHFPETMKYRERLVAHLRLTNVMRIGADPHEVAARDQSGELYLRDPDACCLLRKVGPAQRALGAYDARISGRRQDHAESRTDLPFCELRDGIMMVNPITDWSDEVVESYFEARGLPRHPLVKDGYRSIGCAPCTFPVRRSEPARAGRWPGVDKTECGLWPERPS